MLFADLLSLHHDTFLIFLRVATVREQRVLNSMNTDRMEDEEIHCLKEGGVCADARD